MFAKVAYVIYTILFVVMVNSGVSDEQLIACTILFLAGVIALKEI